MKKEANRIQADCKWIYAQPVIFQESIKKMQPMLEKLETIATKCIRCGKCRKECAFLEKYGFPGDVAENYEAQRTLYSRMPFECSLCGLCTANCPHDLDMTAMFLDMRRQAVASGRRSGTADCMYAGYEKRGTSPHLSFYGLPTGCDTVFFPGCALPATRPGVTYKVYEYLKTLIPNLGIVLDCCTKPSHDLGREDYFEAMFGEMTAYLKQNGISSVIVSCPNCYNIFNRYGKSISPVTVYGLMAQNQLSRIPEYPGSLTIHDPCTLRFDEEKHRIIRKIISQNGAVLKEMHHNRTRTICCGEGGSVTCSAPEYSEIWRRRRLTEAGGKLMVTYCSGCASTLGSETTAVHVLDLFFDGRSAADLKSKLVRFPWTCLNRARLKHRFMRAVPAAVSRVRQYQGPVDPGKKSRISRNTIAYGISAAVARLYAALNGRKK